LYFHILKFVIVFEVGISMIEVFGMECI